jgi:arylsulfatase
LALLTAAVAEAQVLPKPDPPFQGKVDVNPSNSTPDWPKQAAAPKGAPNIVLILWDDTGYSATATFGGATPTPALDRLAAGGLRYNRFHVNPACSPTRAALLTGHNSHQVGFGVVSETAAGYPGYNSLWPKSSASIAEVLRLNGYSTAAFGKWHNTPVWEATPAGPFERWPTGQGFEYFYGFIGYGSSQWEPNLYRNVTAVEPLARPKDGYNLTTDLVNDATQWVQRHDVITPDKPFFLYFAASTAHSPYHAPKQWVDKFKGKFDAGWDKMREATFKRQKELGVIPIQAELPPRPKELAAWDSLSAAQKKLLARQMEVYAGFVAHTDYEIGRLLESIRATGHGDNTIVLYIASDNGPAGEGGEDGRDALTAEAQPQTLEERLRQYDAQGSERFDNAPAAGWEWATNTPFQGAKRDASHLGGTIGPMVLSWPGHIRDTGGVRSQFLHVTDVAPTLLELTGIQAPSVVNGVKQTPPEGVSFAYTLDQPGATSRHNVQYFEFGGSRGIYKDGWWAGSPNRSPWSDGPQPPPIPVEQRSWVLYNLDQDFSQAHDLSSQNPQKLEELKALFDSEARRNNVYPLEPRFAPQPSLTAGRTHFVYHEGDFRIPAAAAPQLAGRAHRITAEVVIPPSGADGVIVAQGGRQGGFTLYIKDRRLIYETNAFGNVGGRLVSSEVLSPGKVNVIVDVTPAGSGVGGFRRSFPMNARLFVNGKMIGELKLRMAAGGDTLDIGSDLVSPVSPKYASPFAFTGKIESVTIDLF